MFRLVWPNKSQIDESAEITKTRNNKTEIDSTQIYSG